MFKPGISGNPSGRPKENKEVRELARKHTKQAIARLVDWMNSQNGKASVAACQILLDRGYGRPAQTTELTGANGGPLVISWEKSAPPPASAP